MSFEMCAENGCIENNDSLMHLTASSNVLISTFHLHNYFIRVCVFKTGTHQESIHIHTHTHTDTHMHTHTT